MEVRAYSALFKYQHGDDRIGYMIFIATISY